MGKRRIAVALSGGVDSATCAGLLAEAGHEVLGLSMRLYNAQGTLNAVGGRCCGPRDLEDARAVCSHLGIPFYVVDYEAEFRRTVIDDFVATYLRGETPNPCVRCNEQVKFLPLLYRARALGCEALATGHYARLAPAPDGPQLLRGVDAVKDQSYFLFGMPRQSLQHVMFPLGAMTKAEVREQARRLGLPVADKDESQEICFVPDGDYAAFVGRTTGVENTVGQIVDENGRVLGVHRGVHHFTIGQRRGLEHRQPEPRYVVSIDAVKQRVVVGPKESLYSATARVADLHWLVSPAPGVFRCQVQIRYRRAAAWATVTPVGADAGEADVCFDVAELAVTPGQAAVFFDGDRVVGGGFIARCI